MRVILLVMIFCSLIWASDIVLDSKTGLMWQDNSDAKSIKRDWEGAQAYCESLTLAGHSDWKLPSIKELQSIVDIKRHKTAIKKAFKNVNNSDSYWSSSQDVSFDARAWVVSFDFGGTTYTGCKMQKYSVRCVRDRLKPSHNVEGKRAAKSGTGCNNLSTEIKEIKESAPVSVNENDLVNPNSSLVSKQKDRQQARLQESAGNQLTDSERQELEQLRAEKAKAAQKKETTSEPVSQTPDSRSFQNAKTDSYETYIARISQKDHRGKRGQKLKDAGTILQQDRANYHKYYKRDREDRGDSRFDARGNRDKIKRMLARGSTSQKTLDAIRYGTPLIKVKIYQNHINVTLESKGSQSRHGQ